MRQNSTITSPQSAPLSQRPGFALLSLMVAVVLLATGVMAIGAANTARLRSQTSSTARSAGLNVARTYLENVRGRDPWSLATETAAQVDGTGAVSASGEYTRVLNVTVVQANLLRIEVLVTGRRLTSPIRLLTNIYRGGTIVVAP
jgi:Tfp pilus assembly protein PilV